MRQGGYENFEVGQAQVVTQLILRDSMGMSILFPRMRNGTYASDSLERRASNSLFDSTNLSLSYASTKYTTTSTLA